MRLELASSVRAVTGLHQVVEAKATRPEALSPALRESVRAGVIQHFEVACDQCWKTMKRWIALNVGAEAADGGG